MVQLLDQWVVRRYAWAPVLQAEWPVVRAMCCYCDRSKHIIILESVCVFREEDLHGLIGVFILFALRIVVDMCIPTNA